MKITVHNQTKAWSDKINVDDLELMLNGDSIQINLGDVLETGNEQVLLVEAVELFHACEALVRLMISQRMAHPISFIGDFKGRQYP